MLVQLVKIENSITDYIHSKIEYILVLKAYLDESGTLRGSPRLCVAGYAASPSEWALFEQEWKQCLDEAGISLFHAKDNECDKLRPFLVRAIANRKFMGVVVSVSPEEYKNYAGEQLKTILGNAYAICARMCVHHVCDYANRNNLGPVELAYEAGQPNAEFVFEVLNYIVNNQPELNLKGVGFFRKQDFIAFHPADFLANSFATQNAYWLSQIEDSSYMQYGTITKELIEKYSKRTKDLINIDRHRRKKEKL